MADGAPRSSGRHRRPAGASGYPPAATACRASSSPRTSANACSTASSRRSPSTATTRPRSPRITAAAKISRRTFYEYFEGKEDCFLAAYEMIETHVLDSMLDGAGGGGAVARPRPRPPRRPARRPLPRPRRRPLLPDRAPRRGRRVAARYREAMQLLAVTLRPEPPPSELDMEVRDQALDRRHRHPDRPPPQQRRRSAPSRAPPGPRRARPRPLHRPRRGQAPGRIGRRVQSACTGTLSLYQ